MLPVKAFVGSTWAAAIDYLINDTYNHIYEQGVTWIKPAEDFLCWLVERPEESRATKASFADYVVSEKQVLIALPPDAWAEFSPEANTGKTLEDFSREWVTEEEQAAFLAYAEAA